MVNCLWETMWFCELYSHLWSAEFSKARAGDPLRLRTITQITPVSSSNGSVHSLWRIWRRWVKAFLQGDLRWLCFWFWVRRSGPSSSSHTAWATAGARYLNPRVSFRALSVVLDNGSAPWNCGKF